MAEFVVTDPATWPMELVEVIERHPSAFEAEDESSVDKYDLSESAAKAKLYDFAIADILPELKKHFVRGYHCTRLTQQEISALRSNGISIPNADLLKSRIDHIESAGLISSAVAERLRTENQGADLFRSGLLWFILYNPSTLGEEAIGRFFRSWGGEALYNMHEEDNETGNVLRKIGMPVLVEAVIPLSDLSNISSLAHKMGQLFHGAIIDRHATQDGAIVRPLQASALIELHIYPSESFSRLTGCDGWSSEFAL